MPSLIFLASIQLKEGHIQFADIGTIICPLGLIDPGHVDYIRLQLIKILLDLLQLLILLLKLSPQGLCLSGRPFRFHLFLEVVLQSPPLTLLEILQVLEATQHHILTLILQTASLDTLHILLTAQTIFPQLIYFGDLREGIPLAALVDDDGVLVVMLDFVESVDHELVEGFLIAVDQQHCYVVIIRIRVLLLSHRRRPIPSYEVLHKIDEEMLLQGC